MKLKSVQLLQAARIPGKGGMSDSWLHEASYDLEYESGPFVSVEFKATRTKFKVPLSNVLVLEPANDTEKAAAKK